MPFRVLLLAGVLATTSAATLCAGAQARSVTADLRVEGPDGSIDPGSYVTGTETIKKATGKRCKPHPGSFRVTGPTAIGLVNSAADARAGLRPVRVRNDSFGLFMCTIGGIVGRPPPGAFSGWLYRVNHSSPSMSADVFRLHPGDNVLWVFADYGLANVNTGNELALRKVPAADGDGSFAVRVVAFDFTGAVSPVSGAAIVGASGPPTDANGDTTVTAAPGNHTLHAVHGSDIPSNRVGVCVNADLSQCPEAHGKRIFGSDRGDRIRDTRGWDRVRARGGDDVVDLRRGGEDRIDCGPGMDRVVVEHGDHDDHIAANCERVLRR